MIKRWPWATESGLPGVPEDLDVGPAHLVCVSCGAWLAASLALHDPARLTSLT